MIKEDTVIYLYTGKYSSFQSEGAAPSSHLLPNSSCRLPLPCKSSPSDQLAHCSASRSLVPGFYDEFVRCKSVIGYVVQRNANCSSGAQKWHTKAAKERWDPPGGTVRFCSFNRQTKGEERAPC